MKKPKEYKIDTFEKLINVVNDKNVDALAMDLAKWLMYCNTMLTEVREKHHEQTKGKLNSEILKCTFIWIDDNKNDFRSVVLENKNTGEITEIKAK